MAGRITHGLVGMVVGGRLTKLRINTMENNAQTENSKDHSLILSSGIFGGYIGGILPDILEPATHFRHRKIMHSKIFGSILSVLLIVLFVFQPKKPSIIILSRFFIESLIAGYLSHLFLDSQTKVGLPTI